MSKLIALQSGTHEILPDAWNSDFSNLKQKALLFDQIGFYKLSRFYEILEEGQEFFKEIDTISTKTETIITELKWLQQEDIIFELTMEKEFQSQNLRDFKQQVSTQKFEEVKKLFEKITKIQNSDLKSIQDQTYKATLIKEQHFAVIRLMSIIMEITRGITAVTTLPYTEYTHDLPGSQKSEAAQIVITKLPLPNNETPWEQIIDYRNDTKNQKNLLNLRRWIRKISAENLSPVEIEEELEWLINEFQGHMELHKIKANTETLEILIRAPFELIENLIKLNLSKIPEPLFSLRKVQLNLMEAELNAPGKEIAYIIKTKDTFQS